MKERDDIEARIEAAATELRSAETSAERLSWARVLYFAAALAVLLIARLDPWPWLALAALPFAVLVRLHRRASGRVERLRGALSAARGALARMDRDWPNMPPLQQPDFAGVANRAAIRDLDLYGERSLFRLVDVSQPQVGGVTLMRWLLSDPEPMPVVVARQESVRMLRDRPDFLLESARLCRHGARPAPGAGKLAAFRRWCDRSGARFQPALVWSARLLTAAFVVAIAILVARPALRQPFASLLLAIVVLQLIVAASARRYLRATLSHPERSEGSAPTVQIVRLARGDTTGAADLLPELAGIVEVIRAITAEKNVGGRFGEIQQSLITDGASAELAKLSRLFEWNAVHYSPMLHAAVNAAVAFDAHLASALDHWHDAVAARVPGWIDLVAEAQALTALATLAHENPGWTMPRLHDDPTPFLEARDCGHPLIAAGQRVVNPVSLERSGSVIVISGSNMSGKTTYLRAVGVNALLALAGGPVCAGDFAIRRSRVRTTVRVDDDLAAGVSLFLAEVSRLRDVVADAGQDLPVLFLLDEILHGTNAEDRRRATQLVLDRLLAAGASGIVTTHDPRIADVDSAGEGRVAQAHFTDSVRPGEGAVTMTFDYVLRPGPATTTNALRILEALGLQARG